MLLLSLPSAICPLLRRLGCCLAFISSSSSSSYSCSSSSSLSSCQFPLGSKATRQQEKKYNFTYTLRLLKTRQKISFCVNKLMFSFQLYGLLVCVREFCVLLCVFAWECVCVCVFVGVCLCVDDALKCYLQLVTYFMRLCFWRKKKTIENLFFFFSFFFCLVFFFRVALRLYTDFSRYILVYCLLVLTTKLQTHLFLSAISLSNY